MLVSTLSATAEQIRSQQKAKEIALKQKLEEAQKIAEMVRAARMPAAQFHSGSILTPAPAPPPRSPAQAGIDIKAIATDHLDVEKLRREARDKQLKEKADELQKRTAEARRMDYLTRAIREAERTKVDALRATVIAETAEQIAAVNEAIDEKSRKAQADYAKLQPKLDAIRPVVNAMLEAVAIKRAAEYKAQKVSGPGTRMPPPPSTRALATPFKFDVSVCHQSRSAEQG